MPGTGIMLEFHLSDTRSRATHVAGGSIDQQILPCPVQPVFLRYGSGCKEAVPRELMDLRVILASRV